jgi:hypothetical protein
LHFAELLFKKYIWPRSSGDSVSRQMLLCLCIFRAYMIQLDWFLPNLCRPFISYVF